MLTRLKEINEKIAAVGARSFGTMTCFWIFFIWGLLGLMPWFPEGFKNTVLLISSAFIQLWSLPLLAVGAVVLGRDSNEQSKQDHEAIQTELALLRQELIKEDEEIEKETEQILLLKQISSDLEAIKKALNL